MKRKFLIALILSVLVCFTAHIAFPKDLHVNIISEAFEYDEIITVNTIWYVEINEILIRVFQESDEEDFDKDWLETLGINTVKSWIKEKNHTYTDYKRVAHKIMYEFEYGGKYYDMVELRYVLSNKKNIKIPKKKKMEDKNRNGK